MNKLLCINNYCTDPYFNLATEEYLLKNKKDDVFMLWCNHPVVVVGKHQNALAEINHDFILKQNIKVARRLSGGGAVYQDLGNLNFTYIMNGEIGKMVDFKKYTNDILQVLNNLGIPARRNLRNNIIINDKKISGNAEHIFKQRVIHHGTLLFNSNLDILNTAIQVENGKYSDKAVQSVRSKVTNISSYLNEKITMNGFRQELMNFVLNKYPHAVLYELQTHEKEEIMKLKDEKYTSWDWIFGYSPKYVLQKSIEMTGGKLDVELSIKKGLILEASFSGNMLNNDDKEKLRNCLLGQRHDKSTILSTIRQDIDCQKIKSISVNEIANHLF